MSQNIAKISVSMSNKDRQLVAHLADEKGLNFSSALRLIIREWMQEKGRILDEKHHIMSVNRLRRRPNKL